MVRHACGSSEIQARCLIKLKKIGGILLVAPNELGDLFFGFFLLGKIGGLTK